MLWLTLISLLRIGFFVMRKGMCAHMVWRKKCFYLSTLSFLIFFSIPIAQFEAQSQVIYNPPKDPGKLTNILITTWIE